MSSIIVNYNSKKKNGKLGYNKSSLVVRMVMVLLLNLFHIDSR